MPSSTLPETAPPPSRQPCPAPADLKAEVARFDLKAEVGIWDGPHNRMTYRSLGDGPLLIVAPGIAATYRVYAILLNRLAGRFRTVIFDYPGENRADGARLGRITHEHLAADFLGLVDHLEPGSTPVFPVGLSFGATVVLGALARRSGRFPKAALQAAYARRPSSLAERAAFAIGRHLPGTSASLPLRERILEYNNKGQFPRLIEDRWRFLIDQNGHVPIRSLAHRLSLLGGLDLRPSLAGISTEILLLRGNEDRSVSKGSNDELAAGLPAARPVLMPNVGHHPYLTHAEALAEVIGQWFVPHEPASCEAEETAGVCGGDPRNCGAAGAGACLQGGDVDKLPATVTCPVPDPGTQD